MSMRFLIFRFQRRYIVYDIDIQFGADAIIGLFRRRRALLFTVS